MNIVNSFGKTNEPCGGKMVMVMTVTVLKKNESEALMTLAFLCPQATSRTNKCIQCVTGDF